MTIKPISASMPMRTNNVQFSARQRNHREKSTFDNAGQSSLSKLKNVPVIVLMAMSPLNATNAAPAKTDMAPEPIAAVMPAPVVSKSNNGGVSLIGSFKDHISYAYPPYKSTLEMGLLDADGDKSTAEFVAFHFIKEDKKNPIGGSYFTAILLGITKNPINAKGEYLIEYETLPGENYNSERLACSVSKDMALFINTLIERTETRRLSLKKSIDHFITNYEPWILERPIPIIKETNIKVDGQGNETRVESIGKFSRQLNNHPYNPKK